MAVVTTLNTFADGTRMDSITKGVVNIDPVDTPFTSNRPVINMTNTIHETNYDVLYEVSSNHTVYEGSDTAVWYNQAPTTLYFISETLRAAYKITKAEYNAKSKTGQNPMAREREKAAKVLKKVYEERAILGTQASGASGTARQMNGIVAQLSTYTTSTASIAFAESGINSHLIDSWNLGAKIDELYLPMQLKRKFSAWTGAATAVNADVKDKRVVNSKNLYESDATELMKVFTSRVLTNFYSAGDASDAIFSIIFGVQGDLIKNGMFGGVDLKEDQPDSMYDTYRGKLQGEFSTVLTNPKGGFVVLNNK